MGLEWSGRNQRKLRLNRVLRPVGVRFVVLEAGGIERDSRKMEKRGFLSINHYPCGICDRLD